MVNKVILVGRLGRDPELRYTGSGTPVANFSLATDERWGSGGETQKKTEWHNVVVWSKLAEICNQYLTKGRLVFIEGRLQTRDWKDKDGNQRRTTEIVASDMKMLGGRPEWGTPGGSDRAGGNQGLRIGQRHGSRDYRRRHSFLTSPFRGLDDLHAQPVQLPPGQLGFLGIRVKTDEAGEGSNGFVVLLQLHLGRGFLVVGTGRHIGLGVHVEHFPQTPEWPARSDPASGGR